MGRLNDGVKAFAKSLSNLRALEADVRAKDNAAVKAAAQVLEAAIKRQLSHPGSGRLYKHRSVTHQASAPGEPPAVDTGTLRRTIGQEVVEGVRRVGSGQAYAAAQEFGHVYEHGVLEPRPFMRPALAEAKEEMNGAAVTALRVRGNAVLGRGD